MQPYHDDGAVERYYDDGEVERRILPPPNTPAILCRDCELPVSILNDCYQQQGHNPPPTVEELEQRVTDLEGGQPYQFKRDFDTTTPRQAAEAIAPRVKSVMDE